MHEDNEFDSCGQTLLWIYDHICHRALLSLPSSSQTCGRRNREENSRNNWVITRQLIMSMSIYYAPLHLALGRPHTITVIVIPYLLFQFFGNSQKNFLNYGYKNPNSIRNFSIQRRFLQNLLFQFLNPLFLPSSIFMRFINIYLFRCNNKITRKINISRIYNNIYEAIRPPPHI